MGSTLGERKVVVVVVMVVVLPGNGTREEPRPVSS